MKVIELYKKLEMLVKDGKGELTVFKESDAVYMEDFDIEIGKLILHHKKVDVYNSEDYNGLKYLFENCNENGEHDHEVIEDILVIE